MQSLQAIVLKSHDNLMIITSYIVYKRKRVPSFSLISLHFVRRVYQVGNSYQVYYQVGNSYQVCYQGGNSYLVCYQVGKNASLIVAKGGGRRGNRRFPYALSNSFPSCCDISATLSCKTNA